jgi:lambda family phage portal protein
VADSLLDQNGQAFPASKIGYDGASRTKRTMANWRPKLVTSEKAITQDSDTLIARAHDLFRNSGLIQGALRTLCDRVVGYQYKLDLRPDYRTLGISREVATDWSLAVQRRWNSYAMSNDNQIDASGRTNLVGFLRAAYADAWLSGDAIAMREFLPNRLQRRSSFKYATSFNLIDGDRLSSQGAEVANRDVRRGIHVGPFGEAIGYYILPNSPNGLAKQINNRLPAYYPKFSGDFQNVFHVFELSKGGEQTRGISRLSSVIERIKQADQMTSAELESAIVNAMMSFYVESQFGQESAFKALGAQDGTFQAQWESQSQWAQLNAIEYDGARITHLFPGEKIGQLKGERGSAVIGEFNKELKREISSGFGGSYSSVSQDWTGASFSSLKAEQAEFWERCKSDRALLINPLATGMFKAWLDEAILRGIITPPAGLNWMESRDLLTNCDWIGSPKPVWDSVGERTAQNIGLMNKTISPYQLANEAGVSMDDMLDDHEEWNNELQRRGLSATAVSRQSVNESGQNGTTGTEDE